MDERPRLLIVGYPQLGAESVERLVAAAHARRVAAPLVAPTRLVPALVAGDGLVLHAGRRTAPIAAVGVGLEAHPRTALALFRAFAAAGVRVPNEIGAAFRSRDRFALAALLAAAGLPTLPLALAVTDEELASAASLTGLPALVGAVEGPPDADLRVAASGVDLIGAATALRRYAGDPVLVMGLPAAELAWRLVVLAGRVIAYHLHRPHALGPAPLPPGPVPAPPRRVAALAAAAAGAAGLDFATVDIVEESAGLAVFALDGWPDLALLEEASRCEIAGPLVEWLLRRP